MTKLRLAIVGFGKIATTRHVPAIAEVAGRRAGRDRRSRGDVA